MPSARQTDTELTAVPRPPAERYAGEAEEPGEEPVAHAGAGVSEEHQGYREHVERVARRRHAPQRIRRAHLTVVAAQL